MTFLLRERPLRAPRASKLDPFEEFIASLVEEHPDIRATRLLEELQERGFDGGYTIVRRYLNKIRPKPKKKHFTLVRTASGKQAQADWSPYKLTTGETFYSWSAILSFSRFQYMRFTNDMKQNTVFRMLKWSFRAFGGIPGEVVFDTMPGVVDRWEFDEPIINLKMLDFAAYYGFTIHVAPRGGSSYKGKIERPFRFLEDSFFNARSFDSLEAANASLTRWLEHRCNARVHRTTGRKPSEMLREEQPLLAPLPVHPYDDREFAYRIADPYGRIQFDGNFYSVPPVYVGRWVYVRASETQVRCSASRRTRWRFTPGRFEANESSTYSQGIERKTAPSPMTSCSSASPIGARKRFHTPRKSANESGLHDASWRMCSSYSATMPPRTSCAPSDTPPVTWRSTPRRCVGSSSPWRHPAPSKTGSQRK